MLRSCVPSFVSYYSSTEQKRGPPNRQHSHGTNFLWLGRPGSCRDLLLLAGLATSSMPAPATTRQRVAYMLWVMANRDEGEAIACN